MPKKLSRLLIEGAPQNRENEFRELVVINIQNCEKLAVPSVLLLEGAAHINCIVVKNAELVIAITTEDIAVILAELRPCNADAIRPQLHVRVALSGYR